MAVPKVSEATKEYYRKWMETRNTSHKDHDNHEPTGDDKPKTNQEKVYEIVTATALDSSGNPQPNDFVREFLPAVEAHLKKISDQRYDQIFLKPENETDAYNEFILEVYSKFQFKQGSLQEIKNFYITILSKESTDTEVPVFKEDDALFAVLDTELNEVIFEDIAKPGTEAGKLKIDEMKKELKDCLELGIEVAKLKHEMHKMKRKYGANKEEVADRAGLLKFAQEIHHTKTAVESAGLPKRILRRFPWVKDWFKKAPDEGQEDALKEIMAKSDLKDMAELDKEVELIVQHLDKTVDLTAKGASLLKGKKKAFKTADQKGSILDAYQKAIETKMNEYIAKIATDPNSAPAALALYKRMEGLGGKTPEKVPGSTAEPEGPHYVKYVDQTKIKDLKKQAEVGWKQSITNEIAKPNMTSDSLFYKMKELIKADDPADFDHIKEVVVNELSAQVKALQAADVPKATIVRAAMSKINTEIKSWS